MTVKGIQNGAIVISAMAGAKIALGHAGDPRASDIFGAVLLGAWFPFLFAWLFGEGTTGTIVAPKSKHEVSDRQ